MTRPEKRHVYTACIIAIFIVLLLFWKRNGGDTINYIQSPANNLGGLYSPVTDVIYDVGGLDLTPVQPRSNDNYAYTLPGFIPPSNGGNFDWMQTTDCACDCDESWQSPVPGGLSQPLIISFPFAEYQPPSTPTWWYDIADGMVGNSNGTTNYTPKAQVIRTSTGLRYAADRKENFGPYNPTVRAYNRGLVSGDNFYGDGVRYIHNPHKDVAGITILDYASGAAISGRF